MPTVLRLLGIACLLAGPLVGCDDDGPSGPNGDDDVPVIVSVTPADPLPGETITISGSNFGSDPSRVAVTLGNLIAAILSVSPTTIVAVVPPSLPSGTATLRVLVAGVSTPATFTITISEPVQPRIDRFEPDTVQAGDTLTIVGQDFGGSVAQVSVTIGGTPAQILFVTDLAIIVSVPSTLSGNLPVVVTVRGEASAPLTLTVLPAAPSPAGSILGRVTNAATGQPIGGAEVTTSPATATVVTDAEGNYRIEDVPAGDYEVTAEQQGFDSGSAEVTVAAGQPATANLALVPLGESTVFGRVTNAATEEGLGNAEVTLSVIGDTVPVIGDTIPIASDSTDELGVYRIEDVSPGTYVLTARANGFNTLSVEITVVLGQLVAVNFPLTPGPSAAVRDVAPPTLPVLALAPSRRIAPRRRRQAVPRWPAPRGS